MKHYTSSKCGVLAQICFFVVRLYSLNLTPYKNGIRMRSITLLTILLTAIYTTSVNAICLNGSGKLTFTESECVTATDSKLMVDGSNAGLNNFYKYIKQHTPPFVLKQNTKTVSSRQKAAWVKAKQEFGMVEVEQYEFSYDDASKANPKSKNVGRLILHIRKFENSDFCHKYWKNYKFNDNDFVLTDNSAITKTPSTKIAKMSALYLKTDNLVFEFVSTALSGDPQEIVNEILDAEKGAFD
jgi:hypothetical protein